MKNKYNIEDVRKWVRYYKKVLSFGKVAKFFGVSKTTVRKLFYKYQDKFSIKFENEVRKSLQDKGLCQCIGKCGKIKQLNQFGFRNDTKRYRNICNRCTKERSKTWYENNKDYVSKQTTKWHKNNPEKSKEIKRNWARNNPEKGIVWKLNNPEKVKESSKKGQKKYRCNNLEKCRNATKEWRRNNPEKVRENKRKRRAKEKEVKQDYSIKDEQITKQIFRNKCFKCKAIENLTIDHHYCLNNGNPLTIVNAVVLCRLCNSKKCTKDPEKFYTEEEIKQINILFKSARKAKKYSLGNK